MNLLDAPHNISRTDPLRELIIRPVPSDRRGEAMRLVGSVSRGAYHPLYLTIAGEARPEARGLIERSVCGRFHLRISDDEGRVSVNLHGISAGAALLSLCTLMGELLARRAAA